MPLMSGVPALRLARELVIVLEHAERGEVTMDELCIARMWVEHLTGELERMIDAQTGRAIKEGGQCRE
jgi:hypothetical protein